MRKLIFQRWCSQAASGVKGCPDREIVLQELFDHMEDSYQASIRRGMEPGDAEAAVLSAMGDAEALAPKLAALHPPFWSNLIRLARRCLLILSCVTLLMFGFYILETEFFDPLRDTFNPAGEPNASGQFQLLSSQEPDVRTVSDDYTLTVEYAAHWRRTYIGNGTEEQVKDYLNLQVASFTPVPWAETPQYSQWFWAVDSLGNYYYSACEDSPGAEPTVSVADYHTGIFTYVHDLWLNPYVSQEAEWIELHYDRNGRDIVLRVDLSGGDTP